MRTHDSQDELLGSTRRPPPVADEALRLLVESVRDYAIFALDPGGHVVSWNQGAERIKGYRREEIVGRHLSVFYTPEDARAGKPDSYLAVAARDGRIEDEGWRVRKDGTRFWANVVITALRDRSGTLVGFAKVTRDLSERHAAEERLRRSEERFRLLVQSVLDYGIFMLDLDGRVSSWNVGAERIQGFTADEVVGRSFEMFHRPDDIAAGLPRRALEIAAREGRFEEQGWRLRKNGEQFWANVVITALRDEEGALKGFAKVLRDLTEQRRAQEQSLADARMIAAKDAARAAAERQALELTALNERLRVQAMELAEQRSAAEKANRAKSDFLAAMSHELRTPLNAIGGYVDLLTMELRGPVTDDQRADLERIRRSQQHLLGLINNILNFSRIDAGQLAYNLGDVPIRGLVDSVVAMTMPLASTREIRFDVRVPDDGGTVYGDGAKIEQILLNLLSNAIKFTPNEGRISLRCERRADRVLFHVQDTGTGIAPEKLELIFEPFVQVGRSLASPQEGMGLGLAISRDLARGMRGDLRVTSVLGEGSTFTLALPARGPAAATESDARD